MEPHEEALLFLTSAMDILVDHPQALTVAGHVGDLGTRFVVTPHPLDMGKVIGKGGRTARALRTILACASMKHRTRYILDIADAKCIHCGCSENDAYRTVSGNCHWVRDFFPALVCSTPSCIEAEQAKRKAA